MALTSVQTVVASKINSVVNRIEKVKRPILWILISILFFGAITSVNSLVRFRYLYPNIITSGYIIRLYVVGVSAFFLVLLLKSIVLFIIARFGSLRTRFRNFLLGIIIFTTPHMFSAGVNIFYPILYFHKKFTYTIFSLAAFLPPETQNSLIAVLLVMADPFEIIQIFSYAVFFTVVSRFKFCYSLLIIFSIQLAFYLIALLM